MVHRMNRPIRTLQVVPGPAQQLSHPDRSLLRPGAPYPYHHPKSAGTEPALTISGQLGHTSKEVFFMTSRKLIYKVLTPANCFR